MTHAATTHTMNETAPALPTGARGEDAFWRSDWIAAAFVAVISFCLYLYTLMPNVGLQDSGELVTAASLFGVPHPPGYPLWSLCGFLLTCLVPIGSYAWRINLESAIFGSGSCVLLTLLVASSSRWLLDSALPKDRKLRSALSFYGSMTAGLILAFSDVVWGQGVFAEVYTLNSFLLLLTLLCFYRWIVAPEKQGWLLATVFACNLGISNHPTMLMILPAFLLPVFLVSRRFFPSFFIGFTLLIVTSMTVLSWYSEDDGMRDIARRLAVAEALMVLVMGFWNMRQFRLRPFLMGLLGTGVVWLLAERWIGGWFLISSGFGVWFFLLSASAAGLLVCSLLDWRFVLCMVAVGWCALMIFAKSPISSETNPPMNWSYSREKMGLYQSIIRGQYGNNLSFMIKDHVGPLVGHHEPSTEPASNNLSGSIHTFGLILSSFKLYGRSLEDNFTLPVCLLATLPFLYFGQLGERQRPWIYFMIFSFILLAFTLDIVNTPEHLDIASLEAVKPFHILSHCVFVTVIGYGIVCGLLYLLEQSGGFPVPLLALVLVVALAPLKANIIECSQRGHWFGWQYGTDMLRPLDRNAIVFGGTDPGRFVPTYMIFCESQQPARFKRDPGFDRSDLYIITQNALADRSYIKYIRDHYDDRFKPKKYTSFEKWLGREKQFPKEGLHLLNDRDYDECYARFEKDHQETQVKGMDADDIFALNGLIAKWIFEANKKKHTFYVEESLPIDWMYPYMVPAGLVMRLNPEPLDKLPPEAIAADRKFWDAYTARLLADPYLRDDYDARQSFSKLRSSIGNMYTARGLLDEALYAFRQAITIGPTNTEVVSHCFQTLLDMSRFEEAEQLVQEALQRDPRNDLYRRMLNDLHSLREITASLKELDGQIARAPRDFDLRSEQVELYMRKRDLPGLIKALEVLVTFPELTHEQFVAHIKTMVSLGRFDVAMNLLAIRSKVDPKNSDLLYNYSAYEAYLGHSTNALRLLGEAIKLKRQVYAPSARADSRFDSLRTNAEFLKLVNPPTNAVK